jgi:hypothetical protein
MNTASERITDKLWRGTLSADEPLKLWGGMGSGTACDGCDEAISATDPEHEMQFADGRTLCLHVACAGLWRILKQALPES